MISHNGAALQGRVHKIVSANRQSISVLNMLLAWLPQESSALVLAQIEKKNQSRFGVGRRMAISRRLMN